MLKDFYDVNEQLDKEHRFTREQWRIIIMHAFSKGENYVEFVNFFYNNICEPVDENHVTNVIFGAVGGIDIFLDDIMRYFES